MVDSAFPPDSTSRLRLRSRAELSPSTFSDGDGRFTRGFCDSRPAAESDVAFDSAFCLGFDLRSKPCSDPRSFRMVSWFSGLRGEMTRRSRATAVPALESIFGLRVTTARLMISLEGTARRRDLRLSFAANSGAAAIGEGLISGNPDRVSLLIKSESSRLGAPGRPPERLPLPNPSAGRIVMPRCACGGRLPNLPSSNLRDPSRGYLKCAWSFPRRLS